jgi:hypothetical protein
MGAPYAEILVAVVTLRLMYAAAAAEDRSVGLWLLIALAWLLGTHLLLGSFLGGFLTSLIALVASYSTMFAVNLLARDEPRQTGLTGSLAARPHAAYNRTSGEMSERLKEHAWKACVGVTSPWVRIPLSPLVFIRLMGGCAIGTREPRQVRKEATVVGSPM